MQSDQKAAVNLLVNSLLLARQHESGCCQRSTQYTGCMRPSKDPAFIFMNLFYALHARRHAIMLVPPEKDAMQESAVGSKLYCL
jgi:hypothetical protein